MSWPSDGEGHAREQRIIPLSERSMVNEECPSTSKETMQWKTKTEERKKRLGMFGYSCPVRQQHEIRQRKGMKEKKQEEGQVSLSYLCLSRENHQIFQLQVGFRRFS